MRQERLRFSLKQLLLAVSLVAIVLAALRALTGESRLRWIDTAALSPDGNTFVVAYDKYLAFGDASTGGLEPPVTGFTGSITHALFSPDGATLATSGYWSGALRIWDVPRRRIRAVVNGLNHRHGHDKIIAFSGSSATIAVTDEAGWLHLINSSDGRTLLRWGNGIPQRGMRLLGDDRLVMTTAMLDFPAVFDPYAADAAEVYWLTPELGTNSLAFSIPLSGITAILAQGETIALANRDGLVVLWDAATRRERLQFQAGKHPIQTLVLSPDGRRLITQDNQ